MNISLQILNQDARRFSVRLVRTDNTDPHVEFFDVSSPQDEAYFTGLRCSVETLFANAFEDGSAADVLFNEDFPMWGISADNISDIQAWLKSHLNPEELSGFTEFIKETHATTAKRKSPQAAGEAKLPDADPAEAVRLTPSANDASRPASETLSEALPPQSEADDTALPVILQRVLDLLDHAEQLDKSWQSGSIQLRLHVLNAKQESLRALALLEGMGE
jgi:hypothetical protein